MNTIEDDLSLTSGFHLFQVVTQLDPTNAEIYHHWKGGEGVGWGPTPSPDNFFGLRVEQILEGAEGHSAHCNRPQWYSKSDGKHATT